MATVPVKTNWVALDKLASADLDNAGIMLNTLIGFDTTATAAGTTVLTVTSNHVQEFTGVTTQSVTLPVATTMAALGQGFRIINNSSGIVTVNSSGANLVYAIPANTEVTFTVKLLSGTTAASWDYKITGTATAAAGSTYSGAQTTISVNVSIANNTATAVIWNVETFNTDAIHSNGTNPSRFTVPTGKAGKWLVQIQTGWQVSATGTRRITIYKNGVAWQYADVGGLANGVYDTKNFSAVMSLAVGDYVESYVLQASGAALLLTGNAELQGQTQFNFSFLGA